MRCQKCNEPFREDFADGFKRLDGTLVDIWYRRTQEFFEAVLGRPLEGKPPKHLTQDGESGTVCQPAESHKYKENPMKSIHMLVASVVLFAAIVSIVAAPALAADKADYVFKNGAIYTIDSKNPTAQAIAIKGKYITYVGTNDGVQPFIGDKTQVIDLKGQMLLPGFVDSHIHPTLAMFAGGADLQYDSLEEVLASVKKWADAHS